MPSRIVRPATICKLGSLGSLSIARGPGGVGPCWAARTALVVIAVALGLATFTSRLAPPPALLGGCCGTTPGHVRAMTMAMDLQLGQERPELDSVIAKPGEGAPGAQKQARNLSAPQRPI